MWGLLDTPLENQVAVLELNMRAPLILTHYYVKKMRARGRGGVINVSSTLASIGTPYNTNYAATKAYNWYMAEGLAYELRHTNIDVQAFLAGGTLTEGSLRMMGGDPPAMMKPMMLTPPPIVKTSLDSLGKRNIVVHGMMNKFMVGVMLRFMPRGIVVRMLSSMMNILIGANAVQVEQTAAHTNA